MCECAGRTAVVAGTGNGAGRVPARSLGGRSATARVGRNIYRNMFGYDFLPNSGVLLDWTCNEVKFPVGGDREMIDTTSLDCVFRSRGF